MSEAQANELFCKRKKIIDYVSQNKTTAVVGSQQMWSVYKSILWHISFYRNMGVGG